MYHVWMFRIPVDELEHRAADEQEQRQPFQRVRGRAQRRPLEQLRQHRPQLEQQDRDEHQPQGDVHALVEPVEPDRMGGPGEQVEAEQPLAGRRVVDRAEVRVVGGVGQQAGHEHHRDAGQQDQAEDRGQPRAADRAAPERPAERAGQLAAVPRMQRAARRRVTATSRSAGRCRPLRLPSSGLRGRSRRARGPSPRTTRRPGAIRKPAVRAARRPGWNSAARHAGQQRLRAAAVVARQVGREAVAAVPAFSVMIALNRRAATARGGAAPEARDARPGPRRAARRPPRPGARPAACPASRLRPGSAGTATVAAERAHARDVSRSPTARSALAGIAWAGRKPLTSTASWAMTRRRPRRRPRPASPAPAASRPGQPVRAEPPGRRAGRPAPGPRAAPPRGTRAAGR